MTGKHKKEADTPSQSGDSQPLKLTAGVPADDEVIDLRTREAAYHKRLRRANKELVEQIAE